MTNKQKIIEGTKEDYIYFLLKYRKTNEYRIFPLYEIIDDGINEFVKCKKCKKNNKVIPTDGYEFTGRYFFCKYCEEYNEDSSYGSFNKQKLFVFTHKYVIIDKLYKFRKNNKIDNYYIGPKKYKCKIIWSNNIIKVNEQIINCYELIIHF